VAMVDDGPVIMRKPAKKLVVTCPDCSRRVHGTGRMRQSLSTGAWYVEYHCPEHGYLWIYDSRTQECAKAITAEYRSPGKRA
jgi:predicted RNA-binding Zn-ribbon protein involved in translation (DUF1610 family)